MFFLKCLSEEHELFSLIKREIDERIWFVYCKSENSEKSKYVLEERRYIDSLIKNGYNKKILTIDLGEFEIWDSKYKDYIRKQISYEIKKTKIFLSYDLKDESLAKRIFEGLHSKGYSVWLTGNIASSQSVENKIRELHYNNGVFMPILTNQTSSSFVEDEIICAHMNKATILPVITDYNLLKKYFILLTWQSHLLDINNLESSIAQLIDVLEQI